MYIPNGPVAVLKRPIGIDPRWDMVPSFSPKVVAVKRVTENQGKRAPGVDGVIWETPEKKAQAVATLHQHGYRTQSLRRVYIAKSG